MLARANRLHKLLALTTRTLPRIARDNEGCVMWGFNVTLSIIVSLMQRFELLSIEATDAEEADSVGEVYSSVRARAARQPHSQRTRAGGGGGGGRTG